MDAKMEEVKPVTKKVRKALGQPSASEDAASKYPDMALCQKIHRLTTKQTLPFDKEAQQAVFDTIAKELENPSLYRHLVETVKPMDMDLLTESELDALDAKNKTTLEELEKKVEEAKESAGDMEVMDARVEIARFAAKSLSETEALEAYTKLIDLPKISSGKKIDALMETSRVASFYGDTKKSDEYTDKASTT
jgi:26S proteasome regulatory subunit N7